MVQLLVFACLASFAFGYLFGSIPFGLILTRLAGTPDIRSIGSGNIGATNVLRTGRKGLAAATLLGDALKGTLAVLVFAYLNPDAGLFLGPYPVFAVALGAFLGHLFPVWLKFKGGKGMATYIGLIFAFAWPAGIVVCLIWLAIAALTRYSSLAGLVASAATPPLLWFVFDHDPALLFALLTVLLWIMHRTNIARLLDGTEHKIGRSVPAAEP
jgi:glycerol-3-phosphate acyltransferase PlsY